jgi:acyl dehydratase
MTRLQIGMRLPELRVEVTHKMIVMGATASRDWQPQHHDPAAAMAAGLPGIIMNNYTQAGLISRYVTDWSGVHGRIGRMRFSMRRPLCPGAIAAIQGMVADVTPGAEVPTSTSFTWVEIDIQVKLGETVATTATVKIALPVKQGGASPWRCPAARWRP